jgi:hypothetical protein
MEWRRNAPPASGTPSKIALTGPLSRRPRPSPLRERLGVRKLVGSDAKLRRNSVSARRIDPARRDHAAHVEIGNWVEKPRSRSMPRPKSSRTAPSSDRLNEPSSGQPKPRSAKPNNVSPSSPNSVASHVAAPTGLKNLAMGTKIGLVETGHHGGAARFVIGAQRGAQLGGQEDHAAILRAAATDAIASAPFSEPSPLTGAHATPPRPRPL